MSFVTQQEAVEELVTATERLKDAITAMNRFALSSSEYTNALTWMKESCGVQVLLARAIRNDQPFYFQAPRQVVGPELGGGLVPDYIRSRISAGDSDDE